MIRELFPADFVGGLISTMENTQIAMMMITMIPSTMFVLRYPVANAAPVASLEPEKKYTIGSTNREDVSDPRFENTVRVVEILVRSVADADREDTIGAIGIFTRV